MVNQSEAIWKLPLNLQTGFYKDVKERPHLTLRGKGSDPWPGDLVMFRNQRMAIAHRILLCAFFAGTI